MCNPCTWYKQLNMFTLNIESVMINIARHFSQLSGFINLQFAYLPNIQCTRDY